MSVLLTKYRVGIRLAAACVLLFHQNIDRPPSLKKATSQRLKMASSFLFIWNARQETGTSSARSSLRVLWIMFGRRFNFELDTDEERTVGVSRDRLFIIQQAKKSVDEKISAAVRRHHFLFDLMRSRVTRALYVCVCVSLDEQMIVNVTVRPREPRHPRNPVIKWWTSIVNDDLVYLVLHHTHKQKERRKSFRWPITFVVSTLGWMDENVETATTSVSKSLIIIYQLSLDVVNFFCFISFLIRFGWALRGR